MNFPDGDKALRISNRTYASQGKLNAAVAALRG
jgi:hypothetical protein